MAATLLGLAALVVADGPRRALHRLATLRHRSGPGWRSSVESCVSATSGSDGPDGLWLQASAGAGDVARRSRP
jgi:hypothetical protein